MQTAVRVVMRLAHLTRLHHQRLRGLCAGRGPSPAPWPPSSSRDGAMPGAGDPCEHSTRGRTHRGETPGQRQRTGPFGWTDQPATLGAGSRRLPRGINQLEREEKGWRVRRPHPPNLEDSGEVQPFPSLLALLDSPWNGQDTRTCLPWLAGPLDRSDTLIQEVSRGMPTPVYLKHHQVQP